MALSSLLLVASSLRRHHRHLRQSLLPQLAAVLSSASPAAAALRLPLPHRLFRTLLHNTPPLCRLRTVSHPPARRTVLLSMLLHHRHQHRHRRLPPSSAAATVSTLPSPTARSLALHSRLNTARSMSTGLASVAGLVSRTLVLSLLPVSPTSRLPPAVLAPAPTAALKVLTVHTLALLDTRSRNGLPCKAQPVNPSVVFSARTACFTLPTRPCRTTYAFLVLRKSLSLSRTP